jgi:hypothetical protein
VSEKGGQEMLVASLGFDGAQDTARTLPLGDEDPAWPSLDQGQESAVTAEAVAEVHTADGQR